VLVAGDGAEALDLIKARRGEISLMVTDLDMPHLAGPALAEHVRTVNRDIQILAISGRKPDKSERDPRTFSNGFLVKPFTVESLQSMVYELISSTQPHL